MDKYKAQLTLHKRYRQATIVKSNPTTNEKSSKISNSNNEVSSSTTISTASASFDSSSVSTNHTTNNGNGYNILDRQRLGNRGGNHERSSNENHREKSSNEQKSNKNGLYNYKAIGNTGIIDKRDSNNNVKNYRNTGSSELKSVVADNSRKENSMESSTLNTVRPSKHTNGNAFVSSKSGRSSSNNDLTALKGKAPNLYIQPNRDNHDRGNVLPNERRRSCSQTRSSIRSQNGGFTTAPAHDSKMKNKLPSFVNKTTTPSLTQNFGFKKNEKELQSDGSLQRYDNSKMFKESDNSNSICKRTEQINHKLLAPTSSSITKKNNHNSLSSIKVESIVVGTKNCQSTKTVAIPQSNPYLDKSSDPSTTHELGNHYSQSHNSNHYMVPTEAQLRWAQFHRRKKAEAVQKNVEKLMSFPFHQFDVEGALSGDGDSSIHSHGSSSTGSDYMNIASQSCIKESSRRKKKTRISRGRRALLRVSARKTEERRRTIQLNGFSMHPDNDFDENELVKYDQSEDHQCMNRSLEIDDITQALHVNLIDDNAVLAERRTGDSSGRDMGIIGSTIVSGKKKKKSNSSTHTKKNNGKSGAKHLKGKRSMVETADEEEERMKRFEEAYLAICNAGENLKDTTEAATIKSNKRWTRGIDVPVAISIDGREYDDLQRSPAFKDLPSSRHFATQTYGAEVNGKQMRDRVASWMTHLPKSTLRNQIVRANPNFLYNKVSTHQFNENGDEVVISPQKMKLMELVERLQGSQTKNLSSNGTYDTKENMKEGTDDLLSRTENSDKFVSGNKSALKPFKIGAKVAELHGKLFKSNKNVESQTEDEEKEHSSEYSINENIESKIQKMAAHVKSSNSVIDTDMQSDISTDDFEYRMSSLMLSPTVITKRLNQAIEAIETCQWDQVSYLVNANPWLAEMADINSNQYLLHKLAFHGTGNINGCEPAPTDLNEDMIKACPASIQKFDSEGNLPLHLASAAGNIDMVLRLGDRFRGGASVKNNQGHLPLHMAVIACSRNYQVTDQENFAERLVDVILGFFPGGLAIADNNGNLPVHLVSIYLKGFIGAEIMHVLLQKAEEVGKTLRFATSVKALQVIDETISDFDTAECNNEEASIHSFKNSMGWTPLMTAVKNQAGWQVLDAILCRDEIDANMFDTDENGKNILQLTLDDQFCDPPSTLSILKFLPKLVTKLDLNGALPIETACLHGAKEEIIMAIALLDLPIDLDAPDSLEIDSIRSDFGESWWYLNCECDDEHVKIVSEILEICNYKQKQALCFAKNKKGRSLLRRATPKCKMELRRALRFDGRYEFVGNRSSKSGDSPKIFEALDFGTDNDPIPEGQKVTLQCYSDELEYTSIISVLQRVNIDGSMLAKLRFFHVDKIESSSKTQYCIAIDKPEITLSDIMEKSKHLNDQESFNRGINKNRYINKLRKVLKMIGEGISHLHIQGIIHGHIDTKSCGRYHDGWKVLDLIGSTNIGSFISTKRTDSVSPPEAVSEKSMSDNIVAHITIDIWAFGKLMYEVLVGKQLIEDDSHKMVKTDDLFLRKLKNWNEDDLSIVVAEVEGAGVGTLAADLISHCLCPFPEHRPKDMKDILSHPYWNDSKSLQGSFRNSNLRC